MAPASWQGLPVCRAHSGLQVGPPPHADCGGHAAQVREHWRRLAAPPVCAARWRAALLQGAPCGFCSSLPPLCVLLLPFCWWLTSSRLAAKAAASTCVVPALPLLCETTRLQRHSQLLMLPLVASALQVYGPTAINVHQLLDQLREQGELFLIGAEVCSGWAEWQQQCSDSSSGSSSGRAAAAPAQVARDALLSRVCLRRERRHHLVSPCCPAAAGQPAGGSGRAHGTEQRRLPLCAGRQPAAPRQAAAGGGRNSFAGTFL